MPRSFRFLFGEDVFQVTSGHARGGGGTTGQVFVGGGGEQQREDEQEGSGQSTVADQTIVRR